MLNYFSVPLFLFNEGRDVFNQIGGVRVKLS